MSDKLNKRIEEIEKYLADKKAKRKLWKSNYIKDVGITLTNLIVNVITFPLLGFYSAVVLTIDQLKLDYTNNLCEPQDNK